MKSKPISKTEEEGKPPIKEDTVKANTQQQGESLLLPLLQGLLHKNTPQVSSQASNEVSNKKITGNISGKSIVSSKLSSKITEPTKPGSAPQNTEKMYGTLHHVEDSGTESGEDLKFIAAGLRDSMQMHSIKDQSDGDLITEVTAALNRLEQSLKEGNDLKIESSKKNALLKLVARLQTGLTSPDKITASTPAPGQNPGDDDETSSPEADARRGSRPGHQRFAKRRNRANRHTVGVSREELADARRYIEEMVMMENLSNCTTPESSAVTPPDFNVPLEKLSPGIEMKPKAHETSPLYRPNQFVPTHLKEVSSTNNSINNPTVQMREKKPKNNAVRQSAHVELFNPMVDEDSKSKRPLSESYDLNQNQFQNPNMITSTQYNVQSEQATLGKNNLYNKSHHSTTHIQQNNGAVFSGLRPSAYTTENTDANRLNRFSNKKLMMKRANTIDIPKPMRYINDMESDSEAEERGISSTKTIGLRGTVQVSVKSKPKQVVPQFQPKTENDHKFLAFIKKQSPTQGLGWNNPNKTPSTGVHPVNNWTNKFGNIKNAFETGAIATSGKPPVPASSARNFWKKTETHQSQVDRVIKAPWTENRYNSDVLTGALKAKQQAEIQDTRFAPKPLPVNKFSHAPLSAFRPIEPIPSFQQAQFRPIDPTNQESYPVFGNQIQQSPTRFLFAGRTVSNSSPTSGLPWVTKPNVEQRVNMAAAKFEIKSPTNGLQRHSSLREQDHHYKQRVASYGNSKMEQKRPSLPDTSQSQYNSGLNAPNLVQNYQSTQYPAVANGDPKRDLNFPSLPYTSTDYTQPSCVSTYIPEMQRDRADSLTNPNSEPLVLTSSRPIISPSFQGKQQQPLKIFDYPSSPESANQTLNDITDDELESGNLMMEYKAESRVMKGPISQQAVTVSNRTSHVGNDGKYERNSKAAKSLLSVMKNINNGKQSEKKQPSNDIKPIPQTCISPDGSSYQAPHVEPAFPALNTTPTNRLPSYVNQQPNAGVQYQSQQSVPYQSEPQTPQSQTSSISYQRQGSVTYPSEPTTPRSQTNSISYQTQNSVPFSTGSYPSQPTTPQSPQYPSAIFQQNPAYVPSVHQQGPSTMTLASPKVPVRLNQDSGKSRQPQYQQQYAPTLQQTYSENTDKYIQQQKSHVHQQAGKQQMVSKQSSLPTVLQQKPNLQTVQQKQLYKQSSQESSYRTTGSYQESMGFSQQPPAQIPQTVLESQKLAQKAAHTQQYVYETNKQNKQSGQTTSHIESKQTIKTAQKNIDRRTYSLEETNKQATRQIGKMQRQNATEAGYQKQIQKTAVQTEISTKSTVDASKSITNYSKVIHQQSTASAETQVYKSSQPEDTPDIVKSSLSKDDFPILKKFGPARPHLYQPNAYQNPLSKSESTKMIKVTPAPGSTSRKFSEPTVITKAQAPQIVETPSTPMPEAKDEIPANIVCRNIAQFTSMARRSFDSSVEATTSKFSSFGRPSPLSKSDSWHQVVQQQNAMKPPSPKGFAPSEGNPLRRVKSGHSLAVPKMFEAGIAKSEVVEKQKTVAAYFSGQKSPNSLSRNSSQTNIAEMAEISKSSEASVSVKKSTVSRIKTSEKTSISKQKTSNGLARSQTMPHIANLNLLDESNVDDAFEQLLSNS